MATAAPGRGAASAPAPAPSAHPADQAALHTSNRALLTVGVMMATIMQILDTTIANVALPHMASALSATSDTITWVLTSYIVASAIAMPITGWLSDRIGSRNLFLIATAGFVLASALCGAAQTLEEMVAFRVLQGITAAFMNPLSQTVMLDINPPKNQARAMSIWGMGIMVVPIMGPLIGGYLTDNFNWRWVFYVNLPIGVICFAILWFLLPSRQLRKRPFDIFGFAMLSLALASFQLMLDRGQDQDWFGSTEIWIEAILAGVCAWIFLIHMITGKRPMFDRALWRNRNLFTAIGFMLVIGVVMMATMALLPPMLQQLFGYSVFETGVLLMPRGVGVVVTMFLAARLQERGVDPRWMIGIGLALAALSLYDMAGWTLMMGSTPFILSGFIQGLGMGLVFMPLNGLAFAGLNPQYRTEGASLLNLSRSIGASVGISIVTVMLSRSTSTSHAYLTEHLSAENMGMMDLSMLNALGTTGESVMAMANAEVTRQAAMIGYLNDFWAMTLITAASVPLVVLLRRPRGAKVENDPGAAGH